MKGNFSHRTGLYKIKLVESKNILINKSDFRIDKIIKLVKKNKIDGNWVLNVEINFPTVIARRPPIIIFWCLKVLKENFILNSYFSKYLKYQYLNHADFSYSEVIELILSKNCTTLREIEIIIKNLKNLGFKHINLDLDSQMIRTKFYNAPYLINKSS